MAQHLFIVLFEARGPLDGELVYQTGGEGIVAESAPEARETLSGALRQQFPPETGWEVDYRCIPVRDEIVLDVAAQIQSERQQRRPLQRRFR